MTYSVNTQPPTYTDKSGALYRLTQKGTDVVNRYLYAIKKVNREAPTADELFSDMLKTAEAEQNIPNKNQYLIQSWQNKGGTSFPLMLMMGHDIEKVERELDEERADSYDDWER